MEEQDAALRGRFEALIESGRRGESSSEQNSAAQEEDAQDQELQATLRDWLLKIALLDRQHKEGVLERDRERLQLGAQVSSWPSFSRTHTGWCLTIMIDFRWPCQIPAILAAAGPRRNMTPSRKYTRKVR